MTDGRAGRNGKGARLALLVVLALGWCAVLVSAWAGAWARHEAREQFRVLQALEHERDELDIEWSQLRLELGTLAMHDRVERLARERLTMRAPAPEETLTVTEDD